MEKIRFYFKSFSLTGNNYVVDRNDGTDASGFYYLATEVDALLAAAGALVEAVNNLISVYDADTPVPLVIDSWMDDIREAIAAVEAIISPPRSSPPPEDTGKA